VLDEILEILIAAVTSGAVQVLSVRGSGNFIGQYKDATELVTQADQRSDAAILSILQPRFRALDPTIGFRLEESGASGPQNSRWVGADPLDGTNHFAAGGVAYSVQAHYVENGVPLVGVVFQPEVYLPLSESANCTGRLAYAIRGGGAFVQRTEFTGADFVRGAARRVTKPALVEVRRYVSCVPLSTKMTREEWQRAERVLGSGIVAVTTGVGGAGGNVMMTIFGGQHVYANLGAGEDLARAERSLTGSREEQTGENAPPAYAGAPTPLRFVWRMIAHTLEAGSASRGPSGRRCRFLHWVIFSFLRTSVPTSRAIWDCKAR